MIPALGILFAAGRACLVAIDPDRGHVAEPVRHSAAVVLLHSLFSLDLVAAVAYLASNVQISTNFSAPLTLL